MEVQMLLGLVHRLRVSKCLTVSLAEACPISTIVEQNVYHLSLRVLSVSFINIPICKIVILMTNRNKTSSAQRLTLCPASFPGCIDGC